MKKILFLILISFILADEVYYVKSGGTLSGIASRYGVSVSDLVAWNGISNPNYIVVGQRIVIKTGGSSQPEQPPSGGGSYTVTDSQMKRMGWTNYNLNDTTDKIKFLTKMSEILAKIDNNIETVSITKHFDRFALYSKNIIKIICFDHDQGFTI